MSKTPLTDAAERRSLLANGSSMYRHALNGWEHARTLELRLHALELAIESALHDLEQCRVWGGTDWNWVGNRIADKRAYGKLRAALEKSRVGKEG